MDVRAATVGSAPQAQRRSWAVTRVAEQESPTSQCSAPRSWRVTTVGVSAMMHLRYWEGGLHECRGARGIDFRWRGGV